MAIIVQKFGGTSVATSEAREALLKQVKKCREEGNDVVVVVSAMGRYGDPYATDTLINLLEQIDSNIILRKKDLMMSCGEIISCTLVSHFLEINNIPSEPLTGYQAGILTNDNFGNSEIINMDITRVRKYLNDGKVVVIAGFQGATEDGEITTLGRGGSDTAAVAIGGYLNAERVDIFTDVPGIAKVDPRIIPEAPYMSSVSYEDMYKLAFEGAKVIHPRAVSTAEKFGIPVRVRSTFSEDLGTLITNENTNYDHKIIGMALEKGVRESSLNEGSSMAKIFVLFDENYKVEIEKELQEFLADSGSIVIDIVWDSKSLSMIVAEEKLVETTQNLYAHYHYSYAHND